MWKAVSLWEKEGTVKCTSSCFLLIRYRARRLATMEDVAIKVASMHSMNQICVELIMQYTIPHTNIVPISDCYSWDNNLYVGLVILFSLWTAGVSRMWWDRQSIGRSHPLRTFASVFSKRWLSFTARTIFIEVRSLFLFQRRYQIGQHPGEQQGRSEALRLWLRHCCDFNECGTHVQGGHSVLDGSRTHSGRRLHQ